MRNDLDGGIVAAIAAIASGIIGIVAGKLFGIGPNQEHLVDTLKDVVDAQNERISQLEKDLALSKAQICALEDEVKRLQKIIVDQSNMIAELRANH